MTRYMYQLLKSRRFCHKIKLDTNTKKELGAARMDLSFCITSIHSPIPIDFHVCT